jgi:hypothetical protein
MFKFFRYTFSLDILWFLIASIISYLLLYVIKNAIDIEYFRILFLCVSVALIYFRWILFPNTSFVFNNILVKVLLLLLNLPFAYFLLQKFNFYIEKIDDYAINFMPNKKFPLLQNLDVDAILLIKNITLMSFIFILVMIVLMQIRIVWLLMRSVRNKYSKDSGY